MAALIFRPYWINNKIYDFAVLGDISLNEELRGKGIAKQLFKFVNTNIEKNVYPYALVIPNEAARKGLSSSGWTVQEKLVHYVNIFDPSDKIYGLIKNRIISRIFGLLFKCIKIIRLSVSPTKGLMATVANKFNGSIDLLWETINKDSIIRRDGSLRSIQWRYEKHPDNNFYFINIMKRNNMNGYVVFSISDYGKECSIYDFIITDLNYFIYAMNTFLKFVRHNENINSIRFVLNEGHPYITFIKKPDL